MRSFDYNSQYYKVSFFVFFSTFGLKFTLFATKRLLLMFSLSICLVPLPVFLISTFLTYFASVCASYNEILLFDVKKNPFSFNIFIQSTYKYRCRRYIHSLSFLITFQGVLSVLSAFSSHYIFSVCFVFCVFPYVERLAFWAFLTKKKKTYVIYLSLLGSFYWLLP